MKHHLQSAPRAAFFQRLAFKPTNLSSKQQGKAKKGAGNRACCCPSLLEAGSPRSPLHSPAGKPPLVCWPKINQEYLQKCSFTHLSCKSKYIRTVQLEGACKDQVHLPDSGHVTKGTIQTKISVHSITHGCKREALAFIPKHPY